MSVWAACNGMVDDFCVGHWMDLHILFSDGLPSLCWCPIDVHIVMLLCQHVLNFHWICLEVGDVICKLDIEYDELWDTAGFMLH